MLSTSKGYSSLTHPSRQSCHQPPSTAIAVCLASVPPHLPTHRISGSRLVTSLSSSTPSLSRSTTTPLFLPSRNMTLQATDASLDFSHVWSQGPDIFSFIRTATRTASSPRHRVSHLLSLEKKSDRHKSVPYTHTHTHATQGCSLARPTRGVAAAVMTIFRTQAQTIAFLARSLSRIPHFLSSSAQRNKKGTTVRGYDRVPCPSPPSPRLPSSFPGRQPCVGAPLRCEAQSRGYPHLPQTPPLKNNQPPCFGPQRPVWQDIRR